MKILKNISVLKTAIKKISNIGFIPTMGSLHKGHISLIKESQKKQLKTLVSIYINPRQFNDKGDYLRYPRNLNKDLNILKRLNVDYVFTPKTKDLYRSNKKRFILKENQKILCAKFRKGHFEGVLSIMNEFTKLIHPKFIFMGEKDFQQLYLVKNYIEKKYDSKIYQCKIIRDKNYVALSSRNNQLSNTDLKKAGKIANFLKNLKLKIKNKNSIDNNLLLIKKFLIKKFNIKIDYLELRNESNLSIKKKNNCKKRIFIAYYINKTRLIDNY